MIEMLTSPFSFASIPHIIFGPGTINQLFDIIPLFGKNLLLVIGEKSLRRSTKWEKLVQGLENNVINYSFISVSGEPSPQLIDDVVKQYKDKKLNLIIGIGGGSVTDAGKAISAMIPQEDSIKDYLEVVGTKKHNGKKIPYIAIPTTSGTGSEATKNAVISEIGPHGFKKSLRHDNLIPDYAIIDPELMITCPSSITAACGMDAFTQLLEAYISKNANPITDSLAYNAIKYMKDAIVPVSTRSPKDINLRMVMAYGSLILGICLANAGLGIIHGLASPIGGFFKIPHGVVCGTLLAESIKMNIKRMKQQGEANKIQLEKCAQIGALIKGEECFDKTKIDNFCNILIETLERWTKILKMDRLGKYGITSEDISRIVNNCSLKNNPVPLTQDEIKEIIQNRI